VPVVLFLVVVEVERRGEALMTAVKVTLSQWSIVHLVMNSLVTNLGEATDMEGKQKLKGLLLFLSLNKIQVYLI
jgi:hypothetical protein